MPRTTRRQVDADETPSRSTRERLAQVGVTKTIKAIGTMAAALCLVLGLAGPAQAADGTFNRAIGFGVNPSGSSGSSEVCTVAANCASGTNGSLGGEFNFPEGVATDAAGNIYVADTNNARV